MVSCEPAPPEVPTLSPTIASTPTAEDGGVQPLPLDGSSLYYYASGTRIALTPSMHWICVEFSSQDSIERSNALQGSIVDAQGETRQLPQAGWELLPLTPGLTGDALLGGINALRHDHPILRHVNPVFESGDAEMAVTDEFIATFRSGTSTEQIEARNATEGVEIVRPILGQDNTYLMRVTREARLDVLAMANRYQEAGFAVDAAPNFVRIMSQ